VFAIDPHDGRVGSRDTSLQTTAPTLDRFIHNITAAGVRSVVEAVRLRSFEVEWNRPVSLLFIDGLHDYENVSRDFFHFERHVVEGGLIAFHDYACYYPGVMTFVDELLARGTFRKVAQAHSLIVVERLAGPTEIRSTDTSTSAGAAAVRDTAAPLVSCLMATCDRPALVPQAIRYFLRQDYPNTELLVIDDGKTPVTDLLPADPRIRHIRLDRRHSMGQKHNIGCDQARGPIVLHWDDDDWMSADRITRQVRHLQAQGGPALTGLSRLYFFEPGGSRAWEYVYPDGAQPWVAGGTFCYFKNLWLQQRFEDISEGADTRFAWNLRGAPVRPLPEQHIYAATVHSANTSRKRTQDPRWRLVSMDRIRELIGGDWSFYQHWPQVAAAT
jgi:hypothetical protein